MRKQITCVSGAVSLEKCQPKAFREREGFGWDFFMPARHRALRVFLCHNKMTSPTNTAILSLKQRLPHEPKCPMCGNTDFVVVESFVNNLLAKTPNASCFDSAVPSVPIACTKCGFLSQHALGVLDPHFQSKFSAEPPCNNREPLTHRKGLHFFKEQLFRLLNCRPQHR